MLRYLISLFFAFPILLSTIVSLFFIDYPSDFKQTPYILVSISIILIILNYIFSKKNDKQYFSHLKLGYRTNVLIYAIGYAIIFLCILDLLVHGVVIFDPMPLAYCTFSPFQHHLRHFSSLVWILAPLSFFIDSKIIKKIFLFSAILFPILFLDRNRLLFSVFSIAVTLLVFDKYSKNRTLVLILTFIISIGGILSFSILGKYRPSLISIEKIYLTERSDQYKSMQLKVLDTVLSCNLPQKIQFSQNFLNLTATAKLMVLYVSSPVFNLATLDYCNFRNHDLIKSQLLPLQPKINIAENVPLISPYLNVATEILPFFALGGWPLSCSIFLLTFFILFYFINKLRNEFNIFYYLIFLRISYCAVFFNFAPQLYTWSTLGFVMLILTLNTIAKYFNKTEYFKFGSSDALK